jgi:hypothetical protein
MPSFTGTQIAFILLIIHCEKTRRYILRHDIRSQRNENTDCNTDIIIYSNLHLIFVRNQDYESRIDDQVELRGIDGNCGNCGEIHPTFVSYIRNLTCMDSTTGLTIGLQSFEWFVSQTSFTGALDCWDDRSLLKLGIIAARNLIHNKCLGRTLWLRFVGFDP